MNRRTGDKFWSIQANPWAVITLLMGFLGTGYITVRDFTASDSAQKQAQTYTRDDIREIRGELADLRKSMENCRK